MTDNSSTAAEVTLATALKVHGAANCPCCGRLIDRGDVSWNDADSGEGTPMTWAQIQCQRCDTEVAHWSSWWPGGGDSDFDEFAQHVLPDWKSA